MQFVVTAYDCKFGGLERRLAVREQHLQLIEALRQQRKCLYAARLEDEQKQPIGSVMIFDYPNKESLEEMLAEEPYTKNHAWERIEITPCVVNEKFLL